MPNYIRNAETAFTPRGADTIYSILDIELQDDLKLFVYPGTLGVNDIWLKYRRGNSRVRTPKHIHWAVDLLIKKFLNRALTNSLLEVFQQCWDNVKGLALRDADTIIASLSISQNAEHL